MEQASNTNADTATPVTPAVATMSAFFTRQKSNEGIEFALDFPDGTPSPHRIRIRGIDSDAFRSAQAASWRRLQERLSAVERKEPTEEELLTEKLRLQSALVVSWTFPEPCTPENVATLLREAPALAHQIDRIAGNRSHFFVKGSPSSTPSPAQNLS
jgi:hypothetical protein